MVKKMAFCDAKGARKISSRLAMGDLEILGAMSGWAAATGGTS